MIRRMFAVIAAAALLPISLAAASASTAAPTTVQSGGIVVEGQLTGSPSPGGVRVALYAMPPQPFMNKLRPGVHVQGKLVGVTTSSPSGAYAITVSHPAAISLSAFHGLVNFQVWADGHGYWTVYGFQRQITAGHALVPMFGPATTTPMRASLTMYKLNRHDAAIAPSILGSGCWVLAPGGDLGPVNVKLEGLWSTIKGVTKYLTYTTDASSSVSIGVEVNDGPWVSGHDGNTSVTETGGGQDFPPLSGTTNRVGETQMEEGFFDTCEISTEYGTFPYAVNGGTIYIKRNPPKATACVPELAKSNLHMWKTESYTFGDGIVLGGTFGIDLSATTGYTHQAEVTIHYTKNGYACGTNGKPLRSTARGVVADATVHGNK